MGITIELVQPRQDENQDNALHFKEDTYGKRNRLLTKLFRLDMLMSHFKCNPLQINDTAKCRLGGSCIPLSLYHKQDVYFQCSLGVYS